MLKLKLIYTYKSKLIYNVTKLTIKFTIYSELNNLNEINIQCLKLIRSFKKLEFIRLYTCELYIEYYKTKKEKQVYNIT